MAIWVARFLLTFADKTRSPGGRARVGRPLDSACRLWGSLAHVYREPGPVNPDGRWDSPEVVLPEGHQRSAARSPGFWPRLADQEQRTGCTPNASFICKASYSSENSRSHTELLRSSEVREGTLCTTSLVQALRVRPGPAIKAAPMLSALASSFSVSRARS